MEIEEYKEITSMLGDVGGMSQSHGLYAVGLIINGEYNRARDFIKFYRKDGI
mgnify:CR=1 FL=1